MVAPQERIVINMVKISCFSPPLQQLLGAAGSRGQRKCSQTLAFKGRMAAAWPRLLQSSEGDASIFLMSILGSALAAPAGGALHVGRPSDPPHFPESFGISVKGFLLLLCRSSNGDFGIKASG